MDLNDKLASYAQKLSDGATEGDALSKRAKKRILQKLGKLKKQIVLEDEQNEGNKRKLEERDNEDVADTNNKLQKVNNEGNLTKKELKVKLRILNQELADFAQKKQLKLANKKIQWAINKGYRLDVHTYTNLINVYVRCNDMVGAAKVLEVDMKSKGIQPNLITYTTLMKGYCESGELNKSSEIFFGCMTGEHGTSGQSLRPNARSLNTFLRGCSRVGAVKAAYKAYGYFKALPVPSSVGTVASGGDSEGVNTAADYQPDASTFEYLVGILSRSANVSAAVSVVSDFVASTSGGKSGTKAAGGADVIENAAIYLYLAKAYALHGSLAHAKKWLLLASSAVKVTQNLTLKENMKKRFQESVAAGGGGGDSSGNGNANNNSKDKQGGGGGTSKSVAMFLNHRRAEIQNELQLLEDYILNVESAAAPGRCGSEDFRLSACLLYLRLLSQVLYFGFDGQCDYDATLTAADATCALPATAATTADTSSSSSASSSSSSSLPEGDRVASESALDSTAERLVLALRDKFGLHRVSPLTPGLYNDDYDSPSAATVHSESYRRVQQAVCAAVDDLEARVRRTVDGESGFIRFEELFPQFARPVVLDDVAAAIAGDSEAGPGATLPPIKLEICSGNGEWVVAQAAADRGAFTIEKKHAESGDGSSSSSASNEVKAVWVALELRCDRVHNTLCQHAFSSNDLARPMLADGNSNNCSTNSNSTVNRNNLAVIGGDAMKILPARFPPSRLSAIFVNHPQPPEQRSADRDKKKTEGSHLLTAAFFAEMHRVLADDGTITIVTDNAPYAKLLADSLVDMAEKALKVNNASVAEHKVAFVSQYLESDASRNLQETLKIADPSSPAGASAAPDKSKKAVSGPSIQIWRGEPGVEAGHVAPSASSYFDRMWDLGQKKRRYFLFLRKL